MKTKKIIIFVLITIMVISLIMPVYAKELNENYNKETVFDYANLLTDEQEDDLRKISKKYNTYNISMIFLTINNSEGKSTIIYSDDFYDTNNFRKNGILFLIDMDNREIYINTVGYCIDAISDKDIDYILNKSTSYASSDNYYKCFQTLEKYSSDYIINYKQRTTQSDFIPTKGSILFTLITTAIIVATLLIKHASANRKPKAQIYSNGSFQITKQNEVFIGTRKHIIRNYYKQSSSNSMGGSSHRSSGGVRHGGGGRKF